MLTTIWWVLGNDPFAFGLGLALDLSSSSQDERYQVGIWFANLLYRTLASLAYS
ncbi:hypothetical protein HanXRQr2_Chr10g0447241 [Helianthus annuus]|uniref:Uncharacterized protein n=1 Tax=Helianthus annuus TaxID=4232 RepID=A0A9K3HYQ4_HELAN|nr:hypothetical protein HanXRQr2_Chr10g0447241 [Helianthus annuus]